MRPSRGLAALCLLALPAAAAAAYFGSVSLLRSPGVSQNPQLSLYLSWGSDSGGGILLLGWEFEPLHRLRQLQ